MSQPYKLCPQCQTPTALNTPSCAKCGRQYRTQFAPTAPTIMVAPANTRGTQDATAAILLSLFIPGAGQLYNRQYVKAALVFFSAPGLFFLPILIGSQLARLNLDPIWSFLALLVPLCWLMIPVVWIGQVIDAALIAGRINRGEPV